MLDKATGFLRDSRSIPFDREETRFLDAEYRHAQVLESGIQMGR